MSTQTRGGSRGGRRLDAPLVGVLERNGRFIVAEPLFGSGPRAAVERGDADVGELVLVGPGKRGARVLRRLGRPDVARDVLEGLMLDRDLRRSYPRAASKEAEGALAEPHDADGRIDLTDLPTFTIDPDDAQDFDDAISARREDGHVRVWVHIADVSAYVRPGGAIDSEAYRRGTSTYVPGAVEPMLPEALSNRACSLRPGEDKLAVTVEMDVAGTDVQRVEFKRTLIRSDKRLTYGDVDEVFAGARQVQVQVRQDGARRVPARSAGVPAHRRSQCAARLAAEQCAELGKKPHCATSRPGCCNSAPLSQFAPRRVF